MQKVWVNQQYTSSIERKCLHLISTDCVRMFAKLSFSSVQFFVDCAWNTNCRFYFFSSIYFWCAVLINFAWVLRPSHAAAIPKTITITTQRERILLVDLLHAEYAHTHSTNRMRSICVMIGSFSVSLLLQCTYECTCTSFGSELEVIELW